MYYTNSSVIYRDGKFENALKSSTDLFGQTLHYGYGVFEGIRAYDTDKGVKIFKAKEHYERLRKSCELINIPFSFDIDTLIKKSYELLELNELREAYIRPLVFCDPNMNLNRPNKVSIMICAWKWGAYLGDKRLNMMISSYCRPHPRSTKIEAKACGHYVNSILASTEAKDKGYDEALLLDSEGYLAEAPGANLFFEKDGILFTPQKGNILPGITRASIIDLCEGMEIEVREGLYTVKDLLDADSAFVCGTAVEVLGINSINGVEFKKEWYNCWGIILQNLYKNETSLKYVLA